MAVDAPFALIDQPPVRLQGRVARQFRRVQACGGSNRLRAVVIRTLEIGCVIHIVKCSGCSDVLVDQLLLNDGTSIVNKRPVINVPAMPTPVSHAERSGLRDNV